MVCDIRWLVKATTEEIYTTEIQIEEKNRKPPALNKNILNFAEFLHYRVIPCVNSKIYSKKKTNFFAQCQIKIIIVMRFAKYSRIENPLTKNELGFFIQNDFWLVPFWRG